MTAHAEQPVVPSPSTQPVSGDSHVESTHHVVTPLAATCTETVLVAPAEPATHAAITVMATAATAPSLRTERIMTPPVNSVVSRNGVSNGDLTQDYGSV
jgi:hypothetical protein